MSAATSVPREQLVAFLGEMLLIRRFEERVTERFRAGDLAGFLHAANRALEDGDVIASTHRAHGHVRANGTPANEVMAELYGKVEGCSHGYGGSMHLYDVERGNMGANAVVGGGVPATVGAALAFQDGQDVEAVHLAALEALTHARAGDGPVFLLCETERLTGHYIGDPQVYRDKDEIRKLRESTARRRRVARVREGRHRPEPQRRAQERRRGAVRRPQATKLRRREEKPMERVAIVARLQEGSETRAAEIIAEGAPFDLAETGFVRHSVYLSASEVVFVFEGLQVDSPLTELVDDRPYPMGPALDQWRAIVDGPPRIARERFGWKRDEAEPLATDLAVGGGTWT